MKKLHVFSSTTEQEIRDMENLECRDDEELEEFFNTIKDLEALEKQPVTN